MILTNTNNNYTNFTTKFKVTKVSVLIQPLLLLLKQYRHRNNYTKRRTPTQNRVLCFHFCFSKQINTASFGCLKGAYYIETTLKSNLTRRKPKFQDSQEFLVYKRQWLSSQNTVRSTCLVHS